MSETDRAGPGHTSMTASFPDEVTERLKSWIERQPAKVTRSAAIVALVRLGLGDDDQVVARFGPEWHERLEMLRQHVGGADYAEALRNTIEILIAMPQELVTSYRRRVAAEKETSK